MSNERDADCWLGFDLGGTKMLAQVYDADLNLLGRERRKTKASSPTDSGLDRIIESIHAALTSANVSPARLAGIGIGCPGPVDMDHGVLLHPPNLAWAEVPVGARLQEEFGCEVRVLNDVDAGMYAEYRFGAAQGVRCAVGVFPGTGIGGGCIYKGEILHGSRTTCMEIGHVQIMPDGPLCGCGRRGCLESLASRLAIAANAARAVFRGEAPKLKEIAGTDLAEIRSGALADAIAADDKVVRDIVREAARRLGISVASVIHILSPDVIVLGGGLVEAMPELFIEQVTKAARKRVMTAFKDTFQVVASELEDDAVALGAAAWAKHKLAEVSVA